MAKKIKTNDYHMEVDPFGFCVEISRDLIFFDDEKEVKERKKRK